MTNIVPRQAVEYSNQRILTTQQIADAYGTTPQTIINNFNRNKHRFTEGKHFFVLEGEILKDFLSTHQNDLLIETVNNRRAPKWYLWTEKGALLLAKILNTDEAWQASEMLVDEYYRAASIIAALKEQNDYLRTIAGAAYAYAAEALRVPHTPPEKGIDLIENWEIDSVLRSLKEQMRLLKKPDERNAALARIETKLSALSAMVDRDEAMLYELSGKFAEQEQALKSLSEQVFPSPDGPKLLS